MSTDEINEIPADKNAEILAICGLNHRTAAVDIRERLALPDEKKPEMLQAILGIEPLREAVVLSTCNRVEMVVAGPAILKWPEVYNELELRLSRLSGVKRTDFAPFLYRHEQRDAVTHVFRVAAGLDSMVLGEPQVLGQLKDAYQLARQTGAAKTLLNRLFDRAFRVAKAVRSRTEIGRRAVSVCYAARELAEQIFGELNDAAVMVLGAGDMGALAMKHFRSAGVSKFYIVNKTLSRACELADECGGVPLTYQSCGRFLPEVDIVIGAAALPGGEDYLIGSNIVEKALEERQGKPQFYIDLGVPRNFQPNIGELSDAFLYNIDDLDNVVQQNLREREHSAKEAQLIVEDEVGKFINWLELRQVENSIRKLIVRCHELEDSQVQKTMKRLTRLELSEAQRLEVEAALRDMAPAVTARLLHEPLTALRRLGLSDQSAIEFFVQLFNLREDEEK